MPFNDNMFRPCPMLENPEYIEKMVRETEAPSTDDRKAERKKCKGIKAGGVFIAGIHIRLWQNVGSSAGL